MTGVLDMQKDVIELRKLKICFRIDQADTQTRVFIDIE